MLGRGYTASLDAVAFTAAGGLLSIAAPADSAVVIDKVVVSQETQTSSEALAILLSRASAGGTGASTPTPAPLQVGDSAFGGTVNAGVFSVQPTLTTVLEREGWNVLAPYIWHPTPEERIVLSPSGIFVVNLENAPGASMTISAVVSFREIGG